MRQIGNVLISDEVWQTRFACDLTRCLGRCCMYGDLGAPISEEEEHKICAVLDEIKPRLSRHNQSFIEAGVSETYKGALHIREIRANTPCPLSFIDENGIILCSLHSLALEKKLPLLDIKPLWCSLFPIMLQKLDDCWAINCYIPDFCHSQADPPPLLLSFSDLLANFFGNEWIELVKKEYELEASQEKLK